MLQLLTKLNFQEAQNKLIELQFLSAVNQDKRPNNDGTDGPATRKATIDLLKNWAGVKASLSNKSLYQSDLDVAKSLGELETSIINNRTKSTIAAPTETLQPDQTPKSGDRPASSLINWTILFLLLGALSSLSVLTLWILFQSNKRRKFTRVEELKRDDDRPRGQSLFKTLYSLVRKIVKSNNEIEKICQGITKIKKANNNRILDEAALFQLQEKLSSLDDIREQINVIFLETVCKLNSHSEQVEYVFSNEQLQQLINDNFNKIQGQINGVSQSFNTSSFNQVHNIATQISSLSSRFQKDISQLSEKISDLIQLNNSQLDKVNQYEQQINFLTEQFNQYQEQHRFLAKHNQTLTETISSLEEEIKHLNQNRSSFSGTDSDLSVKIQALQQQVDNLKRQLAEEKT
jgi:DNA-binding FrmR family transcriptional regulator